MNKLHTSLWQHTAVWGAITLLVRPQGCVRQMEVGQEWNHSVKVISVLAWFDWNSLTYIYRACLQKNDT